MLKSMYRYLVVIVVGFLLASGLGRAAMTHLDGTKFLILHLDGVSAQDFFAMGDAGELPHIWKYFADGVMIRHGLTLFPGGTEIIYPRLKDGLDNSQSHMVGWGYLERERLLTYGDAHIFLEMFSHFPRQSRSQFFTGLPVLQGLNELYLQNIPHLLASYDVLEFFWFNTDVVGHLAGEAAHKDSIRRFDAALGRLLQREGMDQINVILYTDHGMSIGPMELVDLSSVMQRHVGPGLKFFSYPNVYLRSGANALVHAEALGADPEIDLAFVWLDGTVLRGYHSSGYIDIHSEGQNYRYEVSGDDPFAYGVLANDGQYRARDKWLLATMDTAYPGAIPNIHQYASNPHTGEIIVVLNPYKIPADSIGSQGGHAGLHATDLMVPILLRGAAAKHLVELEFMWLHELYSVHVPIIDFDQRPQREEHRFAAFRGWQDASVTFAAELSPTYRWRWGMEVGNAGYQGWLGFDVVRSFLTRLWTGVAVAEHDFAWYRGLEVSLGHMDIHVQWLGSENVQTAITWELSPRWSMVFHTRHGLGVQMRF